MISMPDGRGLVRSLQAGMLGLLIFVPAGGGAGAEPKRNLEFDDLLRAQRLSDPQVSPDGKSIAYVITRSDKAENRTDSDIWLVPQAGGDPRQLTTSPKHDRHPRW